MLPLQTSYDSLYREFHWRIPEKYNIGVDICDKWADGSGRPALIYEKHDGTLRRYSFDELRQLSNRCANLFTARGLGRKSRIGILLPQQPETALAHIAAYKTGAIAVPLFTLFGLDALRYRIADSGTRLIVTDAPGAEKIAQIRRDLPNLEYVLCTDGPASGAESFQEALGAASDEFELPLTIPHSSSIPRGRQVIQKARYFRTKPCSVTCPVLSYLTIFLATKPT